MAGWPALSAPHSQGIYSLVGGAGRMQTGKLNKIVANQKTSYKGNTQHTVLESSGEDKGLLATEKPQQGCLAECLIANANGISRWGSTQRHRVNLTRLNEVHILQLSSCVRARNSPPAHITCHILSQNKVSIIFWINKFKFHCIICCYVQILWFKIVQIFQNRGTWFGFSFGLGGGWVTQTQACPWLGLNKGPMMAAWLWSWDPQEGKVTSIRGRGRKSIASYPIKQLHIWKTKAPL